MLRIDGAIPRLFGLHAPTVGILDEALRAVLPPLEAAPLAADVSLGAWRSHQIASEWCSQLGLAPPRSPGPRSVRPRASHDGVPSCADLIGAGVDAEALGDAATLTAWDAAERIAAALRAGTPRALLVLSPRDGVAWEQEDLLFLHLIAPRVSRVHSPAIVVCTDPGAAPALGSLEWLNSPQPPAPMVAGGSSGLLPSTAGPSEMAILNDAAGGSPLTMPLANGFTLIAPECRRVPAAVPRLEYDRLAARAREVDWLEAYAQYYGNNAFVDPGFMLEQAWHRFTEGGAGPALRLLERAAACVATPIERSIVQVQAQCTRIATSHFDEASNAPDPPRGLPLPLRGFLLLAKGYALTMSADASRAETYLREARSLLAANAASRDYLYLENISALARMKCGDPDGALAIERDIEAAAAALPATDWRLTYIIRINVARLHRRLGDLEAAREAYERAFVTTLGARSTSEAVYTNVCLARLDAERGQPDHAFRGWLRAALHWLAGPTPEALAARVARSVIGRLPVAPLDMIEDVSATLLASLAEAARQSGVSPHAPETDPAAPAPAFLHAGALPDATPADWAAGAPGWGILGCARPLLPSHIVIATPSRQLLSAYVHRLVASISCPDMVRNARTIVVDDRRGQELPGTFDELLESAVSFGAGRVCFDGALLETGDRVRADLELHARVNLAPAVDRITRDDSGTTVVFKRGLQPVPISDDDDVLLACSSDRPSVAELAARLGAGRNPDDLRRSLRRLESARIVYLSVGEESCSAVGISRPSRANWTGISHPSP